MVSIVHAARDLGRIREVSTVLMRHGFGEVVARLGLGRKSDRAPAANASTDKNENLGVRVRLVLEDLGPSFVKLGQIISTRADVLPAGVVSELRKLQDSVAQVPFSAIEERIEQSLGAPIAELFETFDEQPLAAASVAQVQLPSSPQGYRPGGTSTYTPLNAANIATRPATPESGSGYQVPRYQEPTQPASPGSYGAPSYR